MAHIDGSVEPANSPNIRLVWSWYCKSSQAETPKCEGWWASMKRRKCECPCHDNAIPEGLF